MNGLKELSQRGHEEVCFYRDPQSGTMMIVAIHSTALGPALGGTRMMQYDSLESALTDVLRLSEGMSYKNALAGLNLGGGKAVIVADRGLQQGRAELFREFGRFVERFQGRYITAEDLGTTVADMNEVMRSTSYVTGRDPSQGGGGDPSPYTARGVLAGMKACARFVNGSESLEGLHVAIQGVGNVGLELCELLHGENVRLTVADTRPEKVDAARSRFGAAAVPVASILETPCDILAPCATGGIINPQTVGKLRAKIIAGGANNQISGGPVPEGTPSGAQGTGTAGGSEAERNYRDAESVERELFERGIVYAPDFAINPGGVILCYDELEPGGFTRERVLERVSGVFATILSILEESARTDSSPGKIAVRMAQQRIALGAKAPRREHLANQLESLKKISGVRA